VKVGFRATLKTLEIAVLMLTLAAPVCAEEPDMSGLPGFSTAPERGVDHPIRWRDKISIDVFFDRPPAKPSSANTVKDVMEKFTGSENAVNTPMLVRSLDDAEALADAAGLKFQIGSDTRDKLPAILVRSVQSPRLVPSASTSSTGSKTFGFNRQSSEGNPLCSLVVEMARHDDRQCPHRDQHQSDEGGSGTLCR